MGGWRSGGRWFRPAALVLLLAGVVVLAGCAGPSGHGGGHRPGAAPLSSVPDGPGARPAHVGPSQSPSPVAQQTVMKQFAPLDEHGALVVDAQPAGTGSCFATSIAVPLAGVYRCLSDNTIFDPCFAPEQESSPPTVACFADPWSTGRILTLTGALPSYDPDLTDGNPWAIVLSNGARCVAVTGAVPVLGSVELTYQCAHSTVAGVSLDADGNLSAEYGPASGPLTSVGVATAWRGRSYRFAG
jgi:hypothetical protein